MAQLAEKRWRPPRTCDDYLSEFRHCKSLRNRFHHYYTYGTAPSCEKWKADYQNCKEWESYKVTEAKEALQESERRRLAEQKNFIPVWKMRKAPPSDWHKPLDEETQQDS